jgi:hypothetical protein
MNWRAALLASLLVLAGCASLEPPVPRAANEADAACLRWFDALDESVDRAGVRDAEDERIAGFPSLRVNRLSAALAARARTSEAAFATWLEHLRQLDLAGREVEMRNLPAGSAGSEPERLQPCSLQLSAAVRSDAGARQTLIARARVPDRYSSASRAAGLYALTRLPFFAGVQAWQREHEADMREAAAQPRPARRLAPAGALATPTRATAPPPFERDPLGLPRIDAEAAERLLAAHAPLFDIEAQAAYDAIGAPAWQAGGSIGVDTTRPVVYQRLTHTLVGGQALTQLVYTLWFPERPRKGAFDLLGGPLDGVVVRLTLAPDGRPLLLDTIHACGCYHLFFPARGVTLRPDAPTNEEWAFVPASLPEWAPGSRFVVRIASATHYVLGVTNTTQTSTAAATYIRRPESDLRALPRPEGGTRSLYGPDGLVAGSERGERFFFWPMGIASAGAMRQWGHHATAFVGRRHFDDADLIEARFTIDALQAP